MSVTLASKLPDIREDLRRKVSRAVKQSAEAIAETARDKAPTGPTGNLKDSIESKNVGPGRYEVSADVNKGTGDWDDYYAQWVEFGTEASNKRKFGTPAQPFMLPALAENADAAVKRVMDVLEEL